MPQYCHRNQPNCHPDDICLLYNILRRICRASPFLVSGPDRFSSRRATDLTHHLCGFWLHWREGMDVFLSDLSNSGAHRGAGLSRVAATPTATLTPTSTGTHMPSPTATPLPAGPVLTAAVKKNAVALSWTAVQDATRYELWVWDSVNNWMQIGGNNLTGTTCTHTDVTAGTTYCYTLLAVNAAGEAIDWSPYVFLRLQAHFRRPIGAPLCNTTVNRHCDGCLK